jgi:hypothetical protein
MLKCSSPVWVFLCSQVALVCAGEEKPVPTAPAKPAAPLTAKELRPAISRGLAYLEKDGLAWMKERKCGACHHGPFLLWSHNEARLRGFTVDAKRLDEWTAQTLNLFLAREKEFKEKKTGSTEPTNLLLGQVGPPGDGKTGQEMKRVAALLANSQQADGFWKYEGQGQKRPDAEAHETTTMWAILAMTLVEKSDPAYPKVRDRALTWMKKLPAGPGNEAVALRLVIASHFGESDRAKELVRQLLQRQNADGSWNWGKDFPGDPYATGQSLYALGRAGVPSNEPAVQRGWKYLLGKQRTDGSWYAPTKKPGGKDNPVAPYWASAWATIGLLRTLPNP